jgi:hypothetical protein
MIGLTSLTMARVILCFIVLFCNVGAGLSNVSAASSPDIIDRAGVAGLQLQVESTNIMLTWPSAPRESFVVLWRSNATFQTPWVVLTNQLFASSATNKTSFYDIGALSRAPAMATNTNLDGLYRVFVIPDFWFNMKGVVLSGGPQNPGEDFLPFYFGGSETDLLQPWVELFVDGKDQNTGAGQGEGTDIERVNFGTPQKPDWVYAVGLWFQHDLLTNGIHTLQLRSQFTLNNFIGTWSQYLTVSNRPVQVRTADDVTFVGWNDFIGKTNYDIVAQTAAQLMNWRIKIYSASGQFLARKTGRTTNGSIQWDWNLRDQSGHLHNNPEVDHAFFPTINVWPINESQKKHEEWPDSGTWWNQRLGSEFVKKRSSPEKYREQVIGREHNPLEQQVPPRPLDLSWPNPNPTNSDTVLDLGPFTDFIRVTPQYSNAVLSAVLPCFSAVAKKLHLPISYRISHADIAHANVLPFRDMAADVLLKNGWAFEYHWGYVDSIVDTHSYFSLQNPDKIPKYYGKVRMNRSEATQMARDALKNLGIRLSDVFADQEPKVTLPEKIGTNTLPYYRVIWLDPRGPPSVDVGINGKAKQIERIELRNKNLEHPQPKINVIPRIGHAPYFPIPLYQINPQYAHQLVPIMFRAIDEYVRKLALPIPHPLTTDNVARVEIHDNGGWPDCEITLTNGWRFVYRHCMVCGYFTPDDLLSDRHNPAIHIKHFVGQWNLTESQAIGIVRRAMDKLDYPTNNVHMDFAPDVIYPAGYFKKIIPHYFFEWYYPINGELQSRLEAEVNADNGKLESLYYDDKAYWNCRPRIDVPISIKN